MLSEYNAAKDTLGINVMIRKCFLDENGAFTWKFTKKEANKNANNNNAVKTPALKLNPIAPCMLDKIV